MRQQNPVYIMIDCLIIEDNYAFGLDTKIKCEGLGMNVIKLITEPDQIESTVASCDPDIILSDVKLGPNIFAFDILGKIPDLPPVIFFSSYNDEKLYSRSKLAQPYVYLIKPFDDITLMSAIDGALRDKQKEQKDSGDIRRDANKLFVRSKGKLVSVKPRQIVYVESEGNYCYIFAEDRKIVIRSSLQNVLKKIGLREFIQIHRGYVINVNYIEEFNISSNQVMINNVLLPVGRSYKKSLNLLLSTLG